MKTENKIVFFSLIFFFCITAEVVETSRWTEEEMDVAKEGIP